MKKWYILFCLLFLILQGGELFSQQPTGNIIKDFQGIPVIAGYWWHYLNRPEIMDSMVSMGVNFIQENVNNANMDMMDTINHRGMGIILDSSQSGNWVAYYTDAKYTEWEAEGTPTQKGNATLEHRTNIMNTEQSGDTAFLKLREQVAANVDTLIYGPYTMQEVQYLTPEVDTSDQYVNYYADLTLKLEENPYYLMDTTNYTYSPGYPDEPLCVFQITQSKLRNIDTLDCTHVVDSLVIYRNNFDQLGKFKIISKRYKLTSNDCQENPPTNNSYYNITGTTEIHPRWLRDYVQYKIIWLGKWQYLLSVDKVTIYDKRGMDLKHPSSTDGILARSRLHNQVTADVTKHPERVAGWLAVDEPLSIDNYEPIRIVDALLRADNTHLWIQMMGHWDGVWENKNNHFGIHDKSPWTEMKKRIGTVTAWQDAYFLDLPYKMNEGWSDTSCKCSDFRAENIRIAGDENYKQIYGLTNDFGVSLQCGEVHRTQADQRDPSPQELLYEANLGLLYGAKFFTLYTYFAEDTVNAPYGAGTTKGLINFNHGGDLIYTPKYTMFKNTLSPRFKGLFGRTIKNLIPTDQFVGPHGINSYYSANPNCPNLCAPGIIDNQNYRNYLEYIMPNSSSYPINYYMDYGYFTDSTNSPSKEYFMIINRYYNNVNKHILGFRLPGNYKNWKLMNYCDSVCTTLQSIDGSAEYCDTILAGDSHLFGLWPVVKYGGEINFDETISGTNTLTGEMSIGADATLTISGVYDIYNKITVNGTLVVDSGATLNFHNGASLDIRGNIQANKATFNFSPNAAGNIGVILFNLHSSGSIFNGNTVNNCGNILLQPFSNTTIENCNINNSINGISVYACTAQIINNTIYHPAHFGIYDYDNSQDVFITGNKIYHDSTQGKDNPNSIGIYIDNIYYNSWIANNDVQGFNCGIFTVEWSYLTFANPNTDVSNPNNRFMHNHIGIKATDGSHIFAGDPNDPGGYQDLPCQFNTISDNDIPVILTDNSTLFATNNYWGSDVSCDNPPPGDFCWDYCTGECGIGVGINDNSGTFQFGPDFLTEDPWAPPETGGPTKTRTKPVNKYHSSKSLADNEAGNKTSTAKLTRSLVDVDAKDNLMTAMALEKNGMLNEANNIYENMISKGNNVRAALSCLVHQKNKMSKEDISNRLRILLKKNPNNSSAINNMLGHLSLFNNKFDDAVVLFNNVMMNDPKGYDGISARFAKLFAYINIKNDKAKAIELLSEIKSMNLTDNESKTNISMAEDLLGLSKNDIQRNIVVNLEGKNLIPKTYELFQNFPNPFNPETTIRYQIPKAGLVTLKVYDILGREITTLVNENKIEGSYDFTFNASRFPSGVYIYQLRVNDYVSSKKMILLK